MSQSNSLSTLGFSSPPFELGRFDVARIGREEEWNRLVTIYNDSMKKRSSTIGILLGSYGTGKTFLLTKLRDFINTQPDAFANRPVRFLEPENKKNYLRNLVINTFRRGIVIEQELVAIVEKAAVNAVDVSIQFQSYVNVFLLLNNPDTLKIGYKILTGGKILRSEAQKHGLDDVMTIATPEEAFNLLIAFQIVLHWSGKSAFVWMIDELEYIDQLSSKDQINAIDTLKDVWDRQADLASRNEFQFASLLSFLAATPAFWQGKKKAVSEASRSASAIGLVPFLSRIQDANVVEVPSALSSSEAEKLIIARMSNARSGAQPSPPTIPFTPDYVQYVYEMSGGIPRKTIEICDTVLGEAISRGYTTITADVAKGILSSLMVTYEAMPAVFS